VIPSSAPDDDRVADSTPNWTTDIRRRHPAEQRAVDAIDASAARQLTAAAGDHQVAEALDRRGRA